MKTRTTVCTVYICSYKIVHFEKLFDQAACYYDVKNTQYNKQNNSNYHVHTCYKQPARLYTYLPTTSRIPDMTSCKHSISSKNPFKQ